MSDKFSSSGLDHFARMKALRHRLSGLLGCRVDAIEEPVRDRGLRAEIDRDRALAF